MVPVGMQIMCDKFQDDKMIEIAKTIEKIDFVNNLKSYNIV